MNQAARLRLGAGRRDHIAAIFSATIVPGDWPLAFATVIAPGALRMPRGCPAPVPFRMPKSSLNAASAAKARRTWPSRRGTSRHQFLGRDDKGDELLRREIERSITRKRSRRSVAFALPVGESTAPARAIGAALFVDRGKSDIGRAIGRAAVAQRREQRLFVDRANQLGLKLGRDQEAAAGRVGFAGAGGGADEALIGLEAAARLPRDRLQERPEAFEACARRRSGRDGS